MGPWIDGLRRRFLELGYTPGSVRNRLKDVGQLGRWMARADVEASQLTRGAVIAFVRARRADGHRRVSGARSFEPVRDYLRDQGVLVEETPLPTPLDELIAQYRSWLVVERGLASPTVLRYEKLARRFLQGRAEARGVHLVEGLAGSDVVAFLVRESARLTIAAAKGRVAELRSLLRFLYLKGLTPLSLATAVPPVAGWHDTGIPAGFAAEDVQRLLDQCDRDSRVGIRDLGILMLVARLGLRSAEVARLEMGDIDWRGGEIAVRGKARRAGRLPLPGDVGEALSAYVCTARPATPIRQVFVTCKAPRAAIRPDLVSDVARRACQRAGLRPVGAHRLRHAMATEMLRRGATLVQVSQVLRHRDLATTAIYAKVDVVALRHVAQPWPGAQQ